MNDTFVTIQIDNDKINESQEEKYSQCDDNIDYRELYNLIVIGSLFIAAFIYFSLFQ